jgi:hypothetical protein
VNPLLIVIPNASVDFATQGSRLFGVEAHGFYGVILTITFQVIAMKDVVSFFRSNRQLFRIENLTLPNIDPRNSCVPANRDMAVSFWFVNKMIGM